MSQKKNVSYMSLLKEAMSDFTQIQKTVDVKGPMIDPIIGYDGSGEIQTSKDAASILERYYFNEAEDKGVEIVDDTEDDTETVEEGKETKEEEADEEEIEEGKKESDAEEEEEEDEVETSVEEGKEVKDEEEKEDKKEEELDESEIIENAIIEKLIAEMDKEDVEDVDKEEEEEEELDVDKEINEAGGLPGGPKNQEGMDKDELEESFAIFKEQIESEESDLDDLQI